MKRRNFIGLATAFFAAPRIEAHAAPCVVPKPCSLDAFLSQEATTITNQLTNSKLQEVYKLLQGYTTEAWVERHRQAYQQLADQQS